MKDEPNTIREAVEEFHPQGQAYIIAGPTPEGEVGLSYQGSRKQLTALFRHIRDVLREDEGIGNHPNRRDVRKVQRH